MKFKKKTKKVTSDITNLISCFLECLKNYIKVSYELLSSILIKANFLKVHSTTILYEQQHKILNKKMVLKENRVLQSGVKFVNVLKIQY